MPIEVIIMMIGMGLGGHFNKALEDAGLFIKPQIS